MTGLPSVVMTASFVMPAKAGIHDLLLYLLSFVIPAKAGIFLTSQPPAQP
jgi:hypothetical protein